MSKWKAVADNKKTVTQKLGVWRVENIMAKGENAGYQHFLLLPLCFQKLSFSELSKLGILWYRVKLPPPPPFFSPGMVYIHGGFFCLQENGHIVAESNTGGGITVLKQSKGRFNDGQYHVVRYIRTGTNSTLQVDQLPMQTRMHSGKLNSHPDFNILNVSELIVLSENYLIL